MAKVIFDEESKSFSVVEDQHEYGVKSAVSNAAKAVSGHVGKNSRAYITGGSSLVGSGVGALIAKKRAEKKALDAGATPEEAKKAGRRAMIKGAAAGAAAGAVAGEAGQFINKSMQKGPAIARYDKNGDVQYIKKRAGMKSAAKDMYVDPSKKAWNSIKDRLKKK